MYVHPAVTGIAMMAAYLDLMVSWYALFIEPQKETDNVKPFYRGGPPRT